MPNYISKIMIPGTLHSEPVPLAYPIRYDQNVINVLAGQNNAGKSFVLDSIRECLQSRWAHLDKGTQHTTAGIIDMDPQNGLHAGDLYVVMTDRVPQPTTIPPKKIWDGLPRAGFIGLTANPRSTPSNVISYKMAFSRLAYRTLLDYVETDTAPSEQEWLSSVAAREQAVDRLVANEQLYRCKPDTGIVTTIESILRAQLCLRYAKQTGQRMGQIEFALLYGNGRAAVYDNWSDGQKAVFYLLTLINDTTPDILLQDEVENHLHPAFMTEVLAFVKKHVSQSILATHHPHVIFSKLVDRVVYVETDWPEPNPNVSKQVPFVKPHFQPAPVHQVYTLDSAFEKLTAVYKLFSYQDAQLLSQAQRVAGDSEVRFYSALLQIFSTEVKTETRRVTPDAQSEQLVAALKRMGILRGDAHSPKILDYGAGLGRVQQEVAKTSFWQLPGAIEWHCWEPDPGLRPTLEQRLKKASINATVLKDLEGVRQASMDACVFANVLHELTPAAFAAAILEGTSKLSREGCIIVLELYPLGHAEKFAVPYVPERLTSIFQKAGFFADYEAVPVRESTAYCLVAKRELSHTSRRQLDVSEFQRGIEEEWEAILRGSVERYAMREAVEDYRSYRDMVEILTTIASISAWRHRIWS